MYVGCLMTYAFRNVVTLPGLKRQRELATLTQRDLAALAGVQRQTVSRLEQGGQAEMRTVRVLAEALKCAPIELMKPND